MYFSYSLKKLFTILGLVLFLFASVSWTMETKTERYGESRFSQILQRLSSGVFHLFAYQVKQGKLLPNSLAAVTYQNPTASGEHAHAIPVLTYHAIIPAKNDSVSPESFEGHNVGLKEFEDQMFTLKQNGWETITLAEFDSYMKGLIDLPEKSFLLTFDDGAKESFYPVDPLLISLGYEAVTFVLPEYSKGEGTYYYLSQNELARARESGRWDIGSHSANSHAFIPVDGNGKEGAALANLAWIPEYNRVETQDEYEARVRQDLTDSKQMLEDMFGTPVYAFAFPFGDFGQLGGNNPNAEQTLKNISAQLYDYSFYQWWKGLGFTFNYPEEHSQMIKRLSVQPDWTGAELLAKLENGKPKLLPFADSFDKDMGWLTTWGDFSIADSALKLQADPDSGGASVILDGTRHWKNYTVHMGVASPNQTGIAILFRFKDNDHNAMCNLGNGFAHIEQDIDGERRVIKGTRSPDIKIPAGPFTVEATVKDRSVTCAINGKVLVETTFLDPSLDDGGIGIKVWDATMGKAAARIDDITVTSSEDKPAPQ